MNQKFRFIADLATASPEDILLSNQIKYSLIAKQLDEHYKLRGELSSSWQRFLTKPEFVLIIDENDDHKYKIRSETDRIELVKLNDKEIAENVLILLNLAFREGAKSIMNILKVL